MITIKPLYAAQQQEKIEFAEKRLRAITHKTRLDIMAYINAEWATTVKPIYRKNWLEQSIVSAHLKILRDAGIAVKTPQEKKHMYSIDMKLVEKINTAVTNYAAYAKDNPDNLDTSWDDDATEEE